MPIENGGFEDAGARLGEPRGWRLRTNVRSTEIAVFDLLRGFESFAWLTLRRALGTDVIRAVFGTALVDDFASWAVGAAFDFDDVASATAQFDGGPVEQLAPGWDSAVFARSWDALVVAAAGFGVARVDDFVDGWPGTTPRYLDWGAVIERVAIFAGEGFEMFDSSWPPA